MFKNLHYITVLLILVLSFTQALAQIAMPDTVCVGTTRLYSVNNASIPSTYTWKINGVIQTSTRNDIDISWNTVGSFQLTVQEHTANGCDADIRSGVVQVNPKPIANAGPDVHICFGTSVRLNGSGGAVYEWSPSTYLSNPSLSNPVSNIPFAGTYQYVLSVSSNGCKSASNDTVAITVLPAVNIFAGNDTLIAINQSLQLNVVDMNNSGIVNYSWTPSFGLNNSLIKNPVALLNNDISYIVTAQTAEGCIAKDNINIKVFLAAEIYVPNAFSPNNDGKNDILKPILVGIKELKFFAVYNRYGQVVFKTSVNGEGWNGMINGIMQNTGGFVWVAQAIDFKGTTLNRKGSVILIK
jgi:gliding motility-associated-like protein